MVSSARVLGGLAVLAIAMAGSTCKVVNEDHCANQDVRGNDFCRELNTATPYCSPCRREYHGCVDYEPFACAGYDNEVSRSYEDETDTMSDDEPDTTGDGDDSSG